MRRVETSFGRAAVGDGQTRYPQCGSGITPVSLDGQLDEGSREERRGGCTRFTRRLGGEPAGEGSVGRVIGEIATLSTQVP